MMKKKINYKKLANKEARASKQFDYFERGILDRVVYYPSGKVSYYPQVKPESSFNKER